MASKSARGRPGAAVFLWSATAILLAAAALRLLWLHDVPPGLSQDEVLNADIVQFIRQGRHALFFREGYGHEPLYHYWSVPFQVLLGDNVLSIRLPAVFLGLLLVAAALRWVRRDFGLLAALAAGAGLALGWWPIIFSRVGIRPILEPLLLVAAAWFWPRWPWLAGLFLGLSIYSYTAARYVFLLPLGMLLYLALTNRRRSTGTAPLAGLRPALTVLLISLALYLPLALTLRADPSLQQRVEQLSGPLDALAEGDLGPLMQTGLATLGVFNFTGDPRWTYSLPGRPFFDPFTGLLFYLGLGLALWRWRQPQYGLILIWLGLGLLPSAVTPDAPSTVRLVGAMPIVYLLPGLALASLWKQTRRLSARSALSMPHARAAGLVLAVALVALNLGRTAIDGFVRWPEAGEARLKYQTVLLDMARYRQAHPAGPLVVADAFVEPIDLDSFRRNLGGRPADGSEKGRWVQSGAAVAGALVLPAGPEPAAAYVPEFAPVPAALLNAVGADSQPIYRSPAKPSFAVYLLPAMASFAEQSPVASFEQTALLLGYQLLEREAGQPLRLLTSWQVEASWPSDLAIFLHLVDPSGAIVAQHDALDAYARSLQPGDRVLQLHTLDLPETLPPGPLSLQVGLYERGANRRLLPDGESLDRVILSPSLIFD